MGKFIQHFYREGRGRWVCFESCDYLAPIGRIHVTSGTQIHRGYSVNDYDLAAAMDEEYDRRDVRPPHPA